MAYENDPNLDNIQKRVGRIEHQLRWLIGIAKELMIAKQIFQYKENRKLLRKLKKVSQAKKVFGRLMEQLEKSYGR